MITSISQINGNSVEGQMLMAAIVKLSGESQTDKEPDEIVVQISLLASKMYSDVPQEA